MTVARATAQSWLGYHTGDLQDRCGVPRLVALESVASTMDVAHRLAAGEAPARTVVVAERQEAGRGRQGRSWSSAAGEGIWMSMVLRPASPDAVEVLSLRVALHLAARLEALSPGPVQVKWPNDLLVDGLKLAGVLIEARWRGAAVDWVIVGVGVNLREPLGLPGAALAPDVSPLEALSSVIDAISAATPVSGPLSADELHLWDARDMAAGRRCTSPGEGIVRGVTAAGELLVESRGGRQLHRAGSLILEDAP
jgi:BirA family transcriptional regulator, biotin operon repressor / biotin---[acetyl-CoA-carboxylase] ligase